MEEGVSYEELKALRYGLNTAITEHEETLKTSAGGLNIPCVMQCPEWLHKTDMDKAIALYKERKIVGVKYLNLIAKQHITEPLQWTTKFLRGFA
jgi:hypothetical protein